MSRFPRLLAIAGLLAIVSCATRPRGAPPPPLVDDKLYSCHEGSETDGKTVMVKMDCQVSLQADPGKFRLYVEKHAMELCRSMSTYTVSAYDESLPLPGSDLSSRYRHVRASIQCQ